MTMYCNIALGTFFFLLSIAMFIALIIYDNPKNKHGLLKTTYAIAMYLWIDFIIFTISCYFFNEAIK